MSTDSIMAGCEIHFYVSESFSLSLSLSLVVLFYFSIATNFQCRFFYLSLLDALLFPFVMQNFRSIVLSLWMKRRHKKHKTKRTVLALRALDRCVCASSAVAAREMLSSNKYAYFPNICTPTQLFHNHLTLCKVRKKQMEIMEMMESAVGTLSFYLMRLIRIKLVWLGKRAK